MDGGFEESDGKGGGRAFAEAHFEVQQRADVEEIEHFPVSSLGGAVREHDVIEGGGGDGAGDDGGGAGDETVENDDAAARSRAEDEAANRRGFESSEIVEDFYGVVCLRLVKGEGAADDFDFSRETCIVETSASAGGFRRIDTGKGAEQSGGGGGVADAHFTCAEKIRMRGVRESGFQGVLGLGAGHGRFAGEIAGRAADAHVDNHGFDIRVSAQDVDGCATGAKLFDHLSGDFGRIGAYAFFDDAVIGAEDHHRFAADLRFNGRLDQTELKGQIFETAEAALGFCQRIEASADAGFECGVGDGADRIKVHRFGGWRRERG